MRKRATEAGVQVTYSSLPPKARSAMPAAVKGKVTMKKRKRRLRLISPWLYSFDIDDQ
jgi:hypothetical protein